jgi:hypothetical protein
MRKPDLSCFETDARYRGIGPEVPDHYRRAWKVTEDNSTLGWSRPPLNRTPLARWLLHCPYLHPAWTHWLISLIHLKPVDGLPDAYKLDPTCEYELAVFAVDPACTPDADDVTSIWLLSPACIEVQFGGVADRNAIAVAESCLLACIGGGLAPDEELRASWYASVQAELVRIRRGK